MSADHIANRATIDVLDRVLDRGIVVDAWVRTSRRGIDILTADTRLVVASIETYGIYPGFLSLLKVYPSELPSGEDMNRKFLEEKVPA